MKVEFNPDGSIKLPDRLVKKKIDDEKLFQEQPCIKIIKNQISSSTPLHCELKIQASKKLEDHKDIEKIFRRATGKFRHNAQLSIKKINNREYTVSIISGMYRCDWCNNFKEFIKKELNVEVINLGSCFEYSSSRKY